METPLPPHTTSDVKSPELLRDVSIGLSDGLTVPFALAAGLSGAVDSTTLIIIAGVAQVAAGSIAMSLGGYLAGKSELEHYNADLKPEANPPDIEQQELNKILADLGLSEEVQQQAVQEIATDKKKWVDFMMKYELGLKKPDSKRAGKSAFNIGFSYALGGLIPLAPYIFVDEGIEGLKISAVITLTCLFIFGYLKSKFTGVHPMEGALRVTLIGAAAAASAFGIAKLLEGI